MTSPTVSQLMAADRRVTEREIELRKREHDFENAVAERDQQLKDLETRGVQRFATSAVAGFTLGGGLAYLAHDEIANQFGRGSAPSLLALPLVGAFVLWRAPKFFKRNKKIPLTQRVGTYSGAMGMLIVGGYLSYEDYVATTPKK